MRALAPDACLDEGGVVRLGGGGREARWGDDRVWRWAHSGFGLWGAVRDAVWVLVPGDLAGGGPTALFAE